MVLRKAALTDVEEDLSPISGADALSLVTLLTRESWSLSGYPFPTYSRGEIPVRFVEGFGE